MDERGGLEVTRAAVEASSAAAQAILKDGGHGELLAQMMAMLQSVVVAVDEVKKDVRTANTTLGSLAMNELDCTRLVFMTPYTPPEKRSIRSRVTKKPKSAVQESTG